MTNIIKNGQIIRTSHNLRAMLDYATMSAVKRIESIDLPDEGNGLRGTVRVIYSDGAESRAIFERYHIMIDWIRKRRSWKGAQHVMQGPDIGFN